MLPALFAFAPAAISAGQTLMNYNTMNRNKPPLAENTFMGRALAERAKTGIYSPEVRSRIMSNVGRDLGALAQRARSDVSGSLASTGMRNSIAGQRLLAQPEIDMFKNMSDVSSKMDIENEQSKLTALDEYARLKDESRNARRGWTSQFNQSVYGGALNTLASGVQGYQGLRKTQTLNDGINQVQQMMQSNDPNVLEQANALINMLMLRYYAGGE